MTRYQHSGLARPTTLQASIGTGDATCTLTDGSTWPDGSVGPFWLVINPGGATEEKILATSRSGNVLSGLTRGQDGTSPATHAAGTEQVVHCFTALEADQANALIQRAPAGTTTLVDVSSTQTLTGKTLDLTCVTTPIFCALTMSANQSIPNNGGTLTWDTEDADTSSMHASSPNPSRITLPAAGWYHVTAGIAFSSNATGARALRILKNGGASPLYGDTLANAVSGFGTSLLISTMMHAAVNDYIEVFAYQNSGGALNTDITNYPRFTALRVSP